MTNSSTLLTRDQPQTPRFFRLRQSFPRRAITDLPSAINQTIQQSGAFRKILPGQRVAIAVGSRGINHLPELVSTVIQGVKAAGGLPEIIPAMGSHGGATAQGQEELLASLGVSSATMGCPVRSSMETISVGQTRGGFDIRLDRVASQVDHVILINRVKPHTRLTGPLQSGLIKMLMVGLGKKAGATAYHEAFGSHDYRLDLVAHEITSMILATTPILMGLAIIEDAGEQTSHVEAVHAADFLNREPELLRLAQSQMPSLPFGEVDLLIVERIGKEISGTGMDTNIIGRKADDAMAMPDEWPKVKEIYVRGLSEKTRGNALGIGMAAYCHRRVVEQMDLETTRINATTSRHESAARVPPAYSCDRDVFAEVLSQKTGGLRDESRHERVKWVAIRDTLSLGEIVCSETLYDAAVQHSGVEPITLPQPVSFDDEGNLSFF